MYRQMYESCHEAAEANHALIADVGKRFYELADERELFAADGCHPMKRALALQRKRLRL